MATLITLVDNTVPVASDFNTNFVNLNTEVRPVLTGGTGGSSFTLNAVVVASGTAAMSATTTGTAFQILGIPSAGGAPQFLNFPATLSRQATTSEVTNTTGLVNIFGFDVPTAVFPTRSLRCEFIGDFLNSSGVDAAMTMAVSFGASTLFVQSNTITSHAARRALMGTVRIVAPNTTSGHASLHYLVGGTASASTTSANDASGAVGPFTGNAVASLFSPASASTLNMAVQHTAVSGSISARIFSVVLVAE